MSKQDAEKFLTQLETDETFRTSFVSAGSVPARDTVLAAAGLSFNKRDMHEAMAGRKINIPREDLKEIVSGAGVIQEEEMEVIAFMHVYGVTAKTEY